MSETKKINVSIVGPTGYTGLELIRVLIAHPNVNIKYLLSRSSTGEKISKLWPHLEGCCDEELSDTDIEKAAEESDVVFLGLPHLQSQKIVPSILGKTKIIDLSGDFRLKSTEQFEKYYEHQHSCPEIFKDFTYGLPELDKEAVKESQNIANPGCFATACELALLPLASNIENAEVFAITGSSGSGKTPGEGAHHPVRSHNVKSYKIGTHQHLPEITQAIKIEDEKITFVPTSGPFTRGIHVTAFINPTEPIEQAELKNLFKEKYADSPFVRVKDTVQLADVIGSNYCDISVQIVNDKIVIQAVIDNLVKGAAGTAVQNMNLMLGLDESTGLQNLAPLFP